MASTQTLEKKQLLGLSFFFARPFLKSFKLNRINIILWNSYKVKQPKTLIFFLFELDILKVTHFRWIENFIPKIIYEFKNNCCFKVVKNKKFIKNHFFQICQMKFFTSFLRTILVSNLFISFPSHLQKHKVTSYITQDLSLS